MSASAPTLSLPLRESPRLRASAWALHAVAFASVFAAPAPAAVRALCCATLLLLSLRSWRRRRPSPCRLELAGDGRCAITDARGTVLEGTLGERSLALPGVVVLDLKQRGRRHALWLASDAFRDDRLRRLRVRLRVAA